MSTETLVTSRVIINSPELEVFDYVANPDHLPEWVPFYSSTDPWFDGPPKSGEAFRATLALMPPFLSGVSLSPLLMPPMEWQGIEVVIDDIVHGRRIAYRANDVGWTTICDFEPSAGRTILTVTHSLWSMAGLGSSYWMGLIQPIASDLLRRILDGLRRRLEGRAVAPNPQIFFSYRSGKSRYVAGRIFDALTSEFGTGIVFRDTDSLLAGSNWQSTIDAAIEKCEVLIAHVTDKWEEELASNARNGVTDVLRAELEAALSNGKTRVIPVITSDDPIDLNRRMADIQKTLAGVLDQAPRMQAFNAALQAQALRVDPDFRVDLEQLMRAVWNAFRAPGDGRSAAAEPNAGAKPHAPITT